MKRKSKWMSVLSTRSSLMTALGVLLVLFSCTKESVGDDTGDPDGGGPDVGNNNNEIEITEFSINGSNGVVKQSDQTIKVRFVESTILDGLTPEIVFKGDRVIPDPQTPVDFSNSVADPVTYAVEGNDDERREYDVSVEALDLRELKPFVTIWEGDVDRIVIPTDPNLQYAYEVNWGDGTIETFNGDAEHVFAPGNSFGTRVVQIKGIFPAVRFGDAAEGVKNKLQQVAQWGDIEWESMEDAFRGCSNLSITAEDEPNLDDVKSMKNMFRYAFKQGARPDFGDWNTRNVENMKGVFSWSKANPNVADWDTGNVKDMSYMFYRSKANPNVKDWNVSSLVTTEAMFRYASNANPDLSTWNYNIGILEDMSHMLDYSNIQPRELGYALKRVSKALTNYYRGGFWNSTNVEWGAKGRKYCASSTGFGWNVWGFHGWTFTTDGSEFCAWTEFVEFMSSFFNAVIGIS